MLEECATRLANEGNPAKIAVYELAGSQDEVKFLANMDVFFGGATSTYAFYRDQSVLPYVGDVNIESILAFMRSIPRSPDVSTDATEAGDGKESPEPEAIPKPMQPAKPTLVANHNTDAIQAAAKNLVRELSMETAGEATRSHIQTQILVCANFSGSDAGIIGQLAEAAVELNGRFLLLHLDSTNSKNAPIMKRVGSSLSECPIVRVADTRNKGFVVHKPKDDEDALVGRRYDYTSAAGLALLGRDFEARLLPRVLNSEPRPTKLTQPVPRIVGSMFNETVMDQPGDVMLYLYMDGCPHCKKFTEIYKKVAMELRSTDTNGISLVSMRGTRNDVDHYAVSGSSYPRAYLFAEGEKETPYEYRPTGDESGEMSIEHFKQFLEVYSTVDVMWWDDFVKQDIRNARRVKPPTLGGASSRDSGEDDARDEL